MKTLIGKFLIIGSLLLGLGVIACEGTKERDDAAEDLNNLPSETVGDEDKTTHTEQTGGTNQTSTDTTYDSTSDTVYKRR